MEINHNRVVLCTGSREWEDEALIAEQLEQLWPNTWVLHGGARGADFLVHEYVCTAQLVEIRVPYLGYLGKAGGHERNKIMSNMMRMFHNEGMDCSVMAFHQDPQPSRGTAGMLRLVDGTGWSLTEVWSTGKIASGVC